MPRTITLLTLLFLCVSFTSQAQRYRGSGDMVTQERDVAGFTEVSLSSAVKATIRQGSSFSVDVEADDNIIDLVKTEVRGDRLVISLKGYNFNNITVNVDIVMPSLRGLKASGAARVMATGFTEDRIDINLSGASHVSIDNSSTDELELDASGASHLDLSDLKARYAEIDVSGASSVNLYVREEIEGDVGGASRVRCKGGARSDISTSGASSYRSN